MKFGVFCCGHNCQPYAAAAMAGPERIHGIPDAIYRYTRFGSDSCLRVLPKAERDGDWGEIVSRPPLARVEVL